MISLMRYAMFCEKCGAALPENATNCPNCGVSGATSASPKRGKRTLTVIICALLALALLIGCAAFFLIPSDSAFSRLAGASLNTFSDSCRITGSDIKIGTEIDSDIELIIPSALSDGHYAATVDKVTYYRKSDFEYYGYDSDAGLFRRVTPDADEVENELGVSKYLDYITHIANGDYAALAELINSETLATDVINVQKFVKRVNEVIDSYFSDEYMTENYGFAFTESETGGSYAFAFTVKKALDTLYEITEASRDIFSDDAEYNEALDDINELRQRIGDKADSTTVSITVVLSDERIKSIAVSTVTVDSGIDIALTLEFSDYGSATVDEALVAEYEKRQSQLGDKDYLAWYGPITYSDYYKKD